MSTRAFNKGRDPKKIWNFMTFAIRHLIPPPLMELFPSMFLPIFSFAIEFYILLAYSAIFTVNSTNIQCGITCGATNEPSRSSEAIDKCVIINLRNKNGVIAHLRDKNGVFLWQNVMKCHHISWYVMICMTKIAILLSIAILLYRLLFYSIDSHSVLSIAILLYR